jgi:competence protein ComEC
MHRHRGLYLAGITVAWLLGVAWQLQQQAVQPVWGTALLLGAALPCAMLAWRWRRGALLGVLAASLAGFAASDLRASLRLADALPTVLEGDDLVLTGVVASLPDHTPSGLQFRFEVDDARRRGEPAAVPPLVAWSGTCRSRLRSPHR